MESKHHLFTYYDIRARLVEIFGKPITEKDHEVLTRTAKRLHKKSPFIMLDDEVHKNIHRKTRTKDYCMILGERCYKECPHYYGREFNKCCKVKS